MRMRLFAIILFAILLASGVFVPIASADAAPSDRISVTVEGAGPDVVFIPGLATPRTVWSAAAAKLSATHRVHLVQIKGFGEDAGPNATGEVLPGVTEDIAAYIGREIVAKGRPAPAIVGHSLGGTIGLTLAARDPQAVGRLLVVDALPFTGAIFMPGATVGALAPQAKAMRDGMVARYETVKPAFNAPAPACDAAPLAELSPRALSNSPRGNCLIADWGSRSDLRVVGQAMQDALSIDLRTELGKITAPVTVLYAQDDRALPDAQVRALFAAEYAGLKGMTLEAAPGSFHFVMLDQPALFQAKLASFLGDR